MKKKIIDLSMNDEIFLSEMWWEIRAINAPTDGPVKCCLAKDNFEQEVYFTSLLFKVDSRQKISTINHRYHSLIFESEANPTYKYNGTVIKIKDAQAIQKHKDKGISFVFNSVVITIDYLEEKERDDSFELLSSVFN